MYTIYIKDIEILAFVKVYQLLQSLVFVYFKRGKWLNKTKRLNRTKIANQTSQEICVVVKPNNNICLVRRKCYDSAFIINPSG